MRRYFEWVLSHRAAVLIAFALITVAGAVSTSRAVLSSSLPKLFFGDAPEYRAYLERVRAFGSDELIIYGYDDDAPLSGPSLDRLTSATSSIATLPFVGRVTSLLDAQRIGADGDSLTIDTYADLARSRPTETASLTAALREDPRFGGLVIATDGRGGSIVVELTIDPNRSSETTPGIVAALDRAIGSAGFVKDKLHVAGFPALTAEIMRQSERNIIQLFPASALILLAVVFLMFRRLAPALVSLGVSMVAVVWTTGFAALLDREFSVFIAVVPSVTLIVAFSDIIHLWSAYLVELAAGRTREEAILESATDVGHACLMTSMTTFVGFVSISFIPTPMFRLLGVVLGFGVGVALLIAMTVVPIVLSMLKTPAPDLGTGRTSRLLGSIISTSERVSSQRPWLVIGGFIAATLVAIFGVASLKIETEFEKRFGSTNTYSIDQRWFAERFSGTSVLDLFVDAPATDGLIDPATFARVAQWQARVDEDPAVDRTLSVVDVVREIHAALGGEGALPTTKEALAQYMLLFELSGGEDLERLIDDEKRTMRVAARLNVRGVRETFQTSQRVEASAAMLGGGVEVEANALLSLLGWWLDELIDGQRTGIGVSMLVIAVMMVLGFRSLKVGLISMIPNVLPLLYLGGAVGLAYDGVDSDTLIIAMLAIGIGVDDTIHFLMRLKTEMRRTADVQAALTRTFTFAGRAIVITTLILVAGFAPFALSDYYSIWTMGTMLPGVLIAALVADLLLVPALVKVGAIRF